MRALKTCRPSARSLVVSIFGDVVVPHGGAVWLGTLVRWLAFFDINERNARTALGRLATEGWLVRRVSGRRSEFALSAAGLESTRAASRRIYHAAPLARSRWSVLLLGHCRLDAGERERLQRALALLGFGELSPGVWVHPHANFSELNRVLRAQRVEEHALLLDANFKKPGDARALLASIERGFKLRALSLHYQSCARYITPMLHELDIPPDPAQAFCARVLAVHEYRRIVLRDPGLPANLLPKNFAGFAAREVLMRLYARCKEASTAWVRETGACRAGSLPAPGAVFHRRFRSFKDLRH